MTKGQNTEQDTPKPDDADAFVKAAYFPILKALEDVAAGNARDPGTVAYEVFQATATLRSSATQPNHAGPDGDINGASEVEGRHVVTMEDLRPIQKALDKLARLGNEPFYGNSDGNRIAQMAIEQLTALEPRFADGGQS